MLQRWFNIRALVSLTVLASISVMLVTSILMFVYSHNVAVATLHTVIGFCLLLAACWHLKNNFTPLKGYLRLRFWGKKSRYKMTLPIAVGFIALLTAMSWFGVQPIKQFYQWGMTMRASDLAGSKHELRYIVLDKTLDAPSVNQLTVEFKAGRAFQWPQYAIWLETLEGDFVQPIYVTEKLATNNFENRVSQRDKEYVFTDNPFDREGFTIEQAFELVVEPETRKTRFRVESLPVFLHKMMVIGEKENQPFEGKLIADAYTGATMMDNFVYRVGVDETLTGRYKLKLEMNQSFDFNHYYSSDRFPNDAVYSGEGFSAQPSVIYETEIDFDKPAVLSQMALVGRGHHSGKDGLVHSDLSGMTTALQLVDRVLVQVE